VGNGLAGIAFCEQLSKNGHSFRVIADGSQKSSWVAAGLYNPIQLKRMTMAWRAAEQLNTALPFYRHLETKLGVTLDYKTPILRKFASIEEQNLWFEALDKPGFSDFLSPELVQNNNGGIDAPLGFGKVLKAGRIATSVLVDTYRKFLLANDLLWETSFDFSSLQLSENNISYKNMRFGHIVFAEGFGLKQNPLFPHLPLNGSKGELLTIKAPGLGEQSIIKSAIFLIPLQDDHYRVGATYQWHDTTNTPTEAAKSTLQAKLATFLKSDFEIVDHVAAIRPTVADRRPLVGRHPEHKNVFVHNGFGSRGVMIAPYASKQLYDYIKHDAMLDADMDIARFEKRYYKLRL